MTQRGSMQVIKVSIPTISCQLLRLMKEFSTLSPTLRHSLFHLKSLCEAHKFTQHFQNVTEWLPNCVVAQFFPTTTFPAFLSVTQWECFSAHHSREQCYIFSPFLFIAKCFYAGFFVFCNLFKIWPCANIWKRSLNVCMSPPQSGFVLGIRRVN